MGNPWVFPSKPIPYPCLTLTRAPGTGTRTGPNSLPKGRALPIPATGNPWVQLHPRVCIYPYPLWMTHGSRVCPHPRVDLIPIPGLVTLVAHMFRPQHTSTADAGCFPPSYRCNKMTDCFGTDSMFIFNTMSHTNTFCQSRQQQRRMPYYSAMQYFILCPSTLSLQVSSLHSLHQYFNEMSITTVVLLVSLMCYCLDRDPVCYTTAAGLIRTPIQHKYILCIVHYRLQ